MHNHPEFILPDLLKLGYPVVQRRGILPYRTLLDRQKMTDFTKQQMEKSFRYGMSEG